MDVVNDDAIRLDLDNILLSVRASLQHPLQPLAARVGLQCVMQLRDYMWQHGFWREWDADIIRAAQAASELSDATAAAALTSYRAGLKHALGDWCGAVSLAESALSISGDSETRCDALFRIGSACHDLGFHSRSRQALTEALELANTEDRRMAIKHKLYRCLRAVGDQTRADALLVEVYLWSLHSDQEWFRAEVLLDFAGKLRTSNPEEAICRIQESIGIYSAIRFERGLAFANLELARVCIQQGHGEKALEYLSKGRVLFEKMDYRPGLAHVYFALGQVHLGFGSAHAAMEAFQRSADAAVAVGYSRAALGALAFLSLASWRGGAWRLCVVSLMKCIRLLTRSDMLGFAVGRLIPVVRARLW